MKIDYSLSVLGLTLVLEGPPRSVFPSQVKYPLRKLLEHPDTALRAIGLSALTFGLMLLFLVN